MNAKLAKVEDLLDRIVDRVLASDMADESVLDDAKEIAEIVAGLKRPPLCAVILPFPRR
jgi:hypothetical protein